MCIFWNLFHVTHCISFCCVKGKLLKFMLLEGITRYTWYFLKPWLKLAHSFLLTFHWSEQALKPRPESWCKDTCSAFWERGLGNLNLILRRHVFFLYKWGLSSCFMTLAVYLFGFFVCFLLLTIYLYMAVDMDWPIF